MAYNEYLKKAKENKFHLNVFLNNQNVDKKTMLQGKIVDYDDDCIILDDCLIPYTSILSIAIKK